MNMNEQSQFITAREAEALIGIQRDTLKRWFQRGHISARRQGRRLLLFNRAEVESLVRERMPNLMIPTKKEVR
jgi:excisionase family DNA binding protein